jgi:hypothetical protein
MPSRLADTGEYVFRQRRITAETGMFAIGDFAVCLPSLALPLLNDSLFLFIA